MNKKVIAFTLTFSVAIGITAAVQSPRSQVLSSQTSGEESAPIGEIKTFASYGLSGTEEDLYAASDIVFVGQVMGFSQSVWNQDKNTSPSSVQEWESNPIHIYHQVNLKVIKPILGAKAGQVIHVNVLGSSPIRSKLKIGQGMIYTAPNDSSLKVGLKGIFLVSSRRQGAWRAPSGRYFMKQITGFSDIPDRSYFPEKNGTYTQDGKLITLEMIQSKVKLYTPAREKFSREFKLN